MWDFKFLDCVEIKMLVYNILDFYNQNKKIVYTLIVKS